MIFDSPQMLELRKKYEKQPDILAPDIVLLDRLQHLAGERAYLEETIAAVEQNKQKDWLGRLINIDHGQYMGAWFEMMLVSWCREVGQIEIEPNIKGDFPDLSIMVGEKTVILEAKVVLKPKDEREEDTLTSGLLWVLSQIKRPYFVEIVSLPSSYLPDWEGFKIKVEEWMDTNPEEKFVYNDGRTIVELRTVNITSTKLQKVQAFWTGEAKWVNPEPIKQPLREKAGQHKAIRDASYPYVIALYLESGYFSPEEVVEAWFGKETYSIDVDKHQVVNSYIDKTGIHYLGSHIHHTSISGTIVFKSAWSKEDKRHYLDAWYIQNPYAKVYIDPKMFPVTSSFVIKERSLKSYKMGWERYDPI